MACGTVQGKYVILLPAGGSELSLQVGEGTLLDDGPSTQN